MAASKPPRTRKVPGIKKLPDGRYRVRISRQDHKTGRTRNLKGIAPTWAEALKLHEQLGRELAAGKPQRIRLADYARSWLAGRKGTLKPSVAVRYACALDLHILPALGDYFLDAIEPADVQQYVANRCKEPKGSAGNTVLNELRILRTMAKDALAEKRVSFDFAARVKAPPVHRYTDDNPNLLRAEQVVLLFEKLPKRWHPLALLLILTGLRWGEATALEWEDVRGDELAITKSNYRGLIVRPKTEGSVRRVPFPPPVRSLLGPEAQCHEPPKTGLMFPNRFGKLFTGSPLLKAIHKARKEAGIPHKVTVHGLRRTFADLGRRTQTARVIKSITGWTTDAMFNQYTRPDAAEKLEASKSIAKMIEAPKPAPGKDDDE